MRNKKWVAEHRGGALKIEQHKQLMKWALDCIEHLLPLLKNNINSEIKNAMIIGDKWINGNVTTGDAINCSRKIIKYVRALDNKLEIAITRAAGHAVATAHMADHSMGVVYYGQKAMETAGGSTDSELKWQIEHIPDELKKLVLDGLVKKRVAALWRLKC
jgi:hypothetical protein